MTPILADSWWFFGEVTTNSQLSTYPLFSWDSRPLIQQLSAMGAFKEAAALPNLGSCLWSPIIRDPREPTHHHSRLHYRPCHQR